MTHLERVCATVVDLVGGRGEAEVNLGVGDSHLTRFANSFIHQNVGEADHEVRLRVAVDGRVAASTTSRTDDEGLRNLVESTLEMAGNQPVDADYAGLAPSAPIPEVAHFDQPTASASPAARAEQVRAFVEAGAGMKAAGYCATEGVEVAFANSAGQQATGRWSSATIDGVHQTETSAGSGHQTSSALGDIDGRTVGALAAQRARDGQTAEDIEPGRYEVVLAPECVATIAAFFCFYGFNGKSLAEGQSCVEPGTEQFDRRFSLWDDALDPRALRVAFDSEGTPKRRLDLVKDGTSVTVAHDRRSARKANVESTGHAHPQSAAWGPMAMNAFVGTGEQTVEEMIGSVDSGLYVSTFNYCRVLDPKTLAVTGLTRNGTFRIEKGEQAGAVTNLRFTQSFVEALGEGNVLDVEDQARHADSEFGSGFVVAPSLRLAEWNFTGGSAG